MVLENVMPWDPHQHHAVLLVVVFPSTFMYLATPFVIVLLLWTGPLLIVITGNREETGLNIKHAGADNNHQNS